MLTCTGKEELQLEKFDKQMEIVETPAGTVHVVTVTERPEFECILKRIMGAGSGAAAEIPPSQGAAAVKVSEAMPAVTGKTEDTGWLILLSVGPYSGITAEEAGYDEEEWLSLSGTIRKYHELTHVYCRRMYPDRVNAVWDELAADAIGLYAALGKYDSRLAKLFLGIQGEKYTGGRLGNYTSAPEAVCPAVCAALAGIENIIKKNTGVGAFSMIDLLEAEQAISL